MTTGLLIRDFSKDYRELRYANSGSIRFSEIEHNAYRLALTLEITHTDAPRYGNKKTLPDNTHYGYCTLFKGSTVTDSIGIKYPKFRVFDIINNGIWQYHQHTESVQTVSQISVQTSEFVANGLLGIIGDFGDSAVCAVWKFFNVLGDDFVDKFVYEIFDCGSESIPTDGRDLSQYRAFPIASPFPDVVKFKADIPLSFLWRLEVWYLVNPATYIADNPTDTGDETEGEEEYPDPDQGDGDGDGSEFPDSDEPDSESDPRDFGERILGDQGVWNVTIRYFDPGNNPGCESVPDLTVQLPGFANEPPVLRSEGAVNEFGGRLTFLETSLASERVAETCGVAITGLPGFFRASIE